VYVMPIGLGHRVQLQDALVCSQTLQMFVPVTVSVAHQISACAKMVGSVQSVKHPDALVCLPIIQLLVMQSMAVVSAYKQISAHVMQGGSELHVPFQYVMVL